MFKNKVDTFFRRAGYIDGKNVGLRILVHYQIHMLNFISGGQIGLFVV